MTLSAEQHAQRAKGIGASEIPAIAGLSPFTTPLDVYLRKLGLVESQESDQADLGNELEASIARAAAKRWGLSLAPSPGTLAHPQHPLVLATPDFLEEPDGALEVKNVGYRMMGRWTEGLPDYVESQVQVQLAVLGRPRGHVAALLGGRDLELFGVTADAETQGMLLEIAERFWCDHVARMVPPPVDGSDSARKFLERRWPKEERPIIPAPAEADQWADMLRDARARLESAEADKATAENKLKELIGDAAGLKGPQWQATWRAAKSGGVDYKGLVEELRPDPTLVDRYRRPGARRFLFTVKEK